MTVQKVLVVVALCSVPVLLLGKPIHEYVTFTKKKRQAALGVCIRPFIYSAKVGILNRVLWERENVFSSYYFFFPKEMRHYKMFKKQKLVYSIYCEKRHQNIPLC